MENMEKPEKVDNPDGSVNQESKATQRREDIERIKLGINEGLQGNTSCSKINNDLHRLGLDSYIPDVLKLGFCATVQFIENKDALDKHDIGHVLAHTALSYLSFKDLIPKEDSSMHEMGKYLLATYASFSEEEKMGNTEVPTYYESMGMQEEAFNASLRLAQQGKVARNEREILLNKMKEKGYESIPQPVSSSDRLKSLKDYIGSTPFIYLEQQETIVRNLNERLDKVISGQN